MRPASPITGVSRRAGQILRDLRTWRGWTLDDITKRSERIGFPLRRTALANIESGNRTAVTLEELIVIAAVFDVSPMRFLPEDGRPCRHCHDDPPAGYTCQACNLHGTRP